MFIKLTRTSDKTPVWLSVNHISAVYQYYGKETTVVVYGSIGENGFEEVIESTDEVMKAINEALDD